VEVVVANRNISVRLETRDPNLRKQFEAIIRSVEEFDLQKPDDTGRPDLLIFELSDEPSKTFQKVNSLLSSDQVGEVFFASEQTDPSVLLRAIQIGAREFFTLPIEENEIRKALERLKKRWKPEVEEEPESGKIGHIINVIGSKGGTGTTTVAVNLAVSLAESKSAPSVALIDMNLLFGEIPLFMGIKPSYHWGEITKNIGRLDATFLKNILSVGRSGVLVLPSPAYLDSNISATPEIIERLLKVMRGMFDFVIIDGGQSLDNIALKILQMSNTVFVVSILSVPCLSNTNKLLRTFDGLGYPPKEGIKVIINRYIKDVDISIEDAETAIGSKIFRNIANDYRATMSAINKGQSLTECEPRASITKSFKELAGTLLQSDSQPSTPSQQGNNQEKKWWKLSK
jgi:pilus assembly protein CpaE